VAVAPLVAGRGATGDGVVAAVVAAPGVCGAVGVVLAALRSCANCEGLEE
jgi:hypothetical protein